MTKCDVRASLSHLSCTKIRHMKDWHDHVNPYAYPLSSTKWIGIGISHLTFHMWHIRYQSCHISNMYQRMSDIRDLVCGRHENESISHLRDALNALQCVAVCCSVLLCVALQCQSWMPRDVSWRVMTFVTLPVILHQSWHDNHSCAIQRHEISHIRHHMRQSFMCHMEISFMCHINHKSDTT